MINTQASNMADDFAQRMQCQGLTMEQYFQFTGMTAEKLVSRWDRRRLKRIQTAWFWKQIAKAENIEMSDEEVEEEI